LFHFRTTFYLGRENTLDLILKQPLLKRPNLPKRKIDRLQDLQIFKTILQPLVKTSFYFLTPSTRIYFLRVKTTNMRDFNYLFVRLPDRASYFRPENREFLLFENNGLESRVLVNFTVLSLELLTMKVMEKKRSQENDRSLKEDVLLNWR